VSGEGSGPGAPISDVSTKTPLHIHVSLVVVVTLVSGVVGCAPHVQFAKRPALSASLEEREAFAATHAPTSLRPAGQGPLWAEGSPSLRLQNGTQIAHPEDLLPLVDNDSPTAAAIHEANTADTIADVASAAGLAVMTGSLVVMAVDFTGRFGASDVNIPRLLLPAYLTATVAFFGNMFSFSQRNTAIRARETAFLTFETSMRDALGLVATSTVAPPTPLHTTTPATVPLEPENPPPRPSTTSLVIASLPASCPGSDDVRAAIATRLGHDPFVTGGADRTIFIDVIELGDTVTARFALKRGDVIDGERTFTGPTGSCAEQVSRVALAIATVLDPAWSTP
jgi:hypothetical protein